MILPAPMLLHEGKKQHPFGQDGWLYEIKFDGWRMLAGVNDGRVVLNTRRGVDCTKWFPEVVQGLSKLPGGPHVLDGEACVLDEIGKSDFDRMQDRAKRRRWYEGCDPVVFCAFDLLATEGRSLINDPVENRKAALNKLLQARPDGTMYVGHFPAMQGADLYRQACALKLEGLVAKRLGSRYVPGERSQHWVKCKVPGAVSPERFADRWRAT